jgi:glycerol uptake facilitator-like aquaporin
MTIVFGCARGRRPETGPFAAGAWLAAAIMATPSTSYANPAVTVAALFVTGPIALSTTTALIYVPAQIVGALIALLVIVTVYPRRFTSERPAVERLMAREQTLP